jgi:LytR cell envelope-related transcriptional attenuator
VDWLQLLTPSLAILALFAAAALLVQSVRHGRAIRRMEERLAERGGSPASQAALDRIAQLQARASTSQGGLPEPRRPGRIGAVGGASVAVLALVGVGSWYLFARGDDGKARPRTTRPASVPTPSSNEVPATVPPLENKANYTVAVLNASGVEGAARLNVAPQVSASGYQVGNIGNAVRNDLARSLVMFAPGEQVVAWNVAKDLHITKITPLDGAAAPDVGNSDAVVIVGKDLASSP